MHPLWTPTADQISNANMTKFMAFAAARYGLEFKNYQQLYDWSSANCEAFWDTIWDFCEVIASVKGERITAPSTEFKKYRYFPEAQLNYAENLLRHQDDAPAIIFWGEDQKKVTLSKDELYQQVEKIAADLKSLGVKKGDRVAGLMPNIPEAMVAALATASIGAIWSSCSPDFGVQGIIDRFGQIDPKVLFVADGYFYKGKAFSSFEKLQSLVSELPSLEKTILVRYVNTPDSFQDLTDITIFDEVVVKPALQPLTFEQVSFDHPLFIMFSSGTTGVPKCIVHGHGGTLLQHLKEHQLHCDIKQGDRLFYFTTTSWMMWNWLLSGLASGATLVLYDGSPFHPHPSILFDLAEQKKVTHFGTSAKYIDALQKANAQPRQTHNLEKLRMIASTGSTLSPESFDYVYQEIAPHICLASISGGTDILSCFALGNPVAPVWRGELQTRGLGMAVDVYDEQGRSVQGQKGELVCIKPFPSMPVGFWNDPDGSKFNKAYFEKYSDVWHHGDYIELTSHQGIIIFGRSDAVLNPGGVRIGTAEIYRQVEKVEEVLESLVIGQQWQGDERVVLFVKLRSGLSLTDELQQRICRVIRENTTTRHVPSVILAVADIPRTVSGKIVELAVRDIIHGRPVKNRESLANPEALKLFQNIPELQEPNAAPGA